MIGMRWIAWVMMVGMTVTAAWCEETPRIPVGLDAYRMWDQWPTQRIGARAYMRSTYDRAGANERADASHFLYMENEDFNVSLDVEGPGVLYFVRTNHWHGSPWHYVVDGTDHIVKETATADPVNAKQRFNETVFIPEGPFPNPLTWTWSTTKGADLMWAPIAFEKSLRLAYSRTFYGTGYYIFHKYLNDANLSRPLKAWDGKTPPDTDVLDLLRRAGTDIAPKNIDGGGGVARVKGGETVQFAEAEGTGPGVIRAIKMTLPLERAVELGKLRLRVTWDNRKEPSIDAPLDLFFGAGVLYNRDQREFLVKALPTNIRFDYAAKKVELACYFPMPYFKCAAFELSGLPPGAPEAKIPFEIRDEPYRGPANHVGYFHATYRDHPVPEYGRDMVLLDTQGIEGGQAWAGNFVGTSFIFSHRSVLNTLEGDPRFFFDDSQTPQAQGTGTEEWGGGGDYWGGRNMTLPLAGHPCGAPKAEEARAPEDHIQSAYRFLLADLMPFGRRAVIRLEHGGENTSTEHYETVAYWYGLPGAALVKTDELDIGKPEDEKAHGYISQEASDVESITSRYEWGVDSLPKPGAGAEAESGPAAEPKNYAEFEFEADAGKPYFIWARGRALSKDLHTDAFWIQFDEEIGTTRQGTGYKSEKGLGNWADEFSAEETWSSSLPKDAPLSVTFKEGGRHRARIQPRHTPFHLGQIWLSATQRTRPEKGAIAKRADGASGVIDEIVLNAASAVRCTGTVNVITDAKASDGKALAVGKPDGGRIEIYPAHTEDGRRTRGTSEFTLALRPANHGALLRRTLDYQYPNQRAEVFVADASGGKAGDELKWETAGAWYLAGSNTCVFSSPKGELGARVPVVQTSNRRFRDDEFLIDKKLTQGRTAIRVRVKFTPVRRELLPGKAYPEEPAWSELKYQAYCWVLPEFRM